MKNWSFNACAIAGFSCSGLAVVLLFVNALAHNSYFSVVIPVAIVALLVGGALSVRAHWLWIHGRSKPLS